MGQDLAMQVLRARARITPEFLAEESTLIEWEAANPKASARGG